MSLMDTVLALLLSMTAPAVESTTPPSAEAAAPISAPPTWSVTQRSSEESDPKISNGF